MAEDRRACGPTCGPLRRHEANPRYFADRRGRPVYLAGSHTWANLIEHHTGPDEADFDWPAYLEMMVGHHHNFMRLWGWEHARWATWDGTGRFYACPLPWARTGPGRALDGLPKFDLHKFDPAYFERLRRRVQEAARYGIYCAVKLFDGFSVGYKGPDTHRQVPERNPYRGHPFHRDNNVSGIDGDPDNTGQGKALQTLRLPEVTRLQEAYVRKAIDTVGDLDNVLWEICNESDGTPDAVRWQYHLIDFIRRQEAVRAVQHPVGMTVPYPDGCNRDLFASPADWISPNHTDAEPYRTDPPPADGSKVIVADTDHLWGHGGEQAWVWKSFARGLNLLLMDPWEPIRGGDLWDCNDRDHPIWEPVRRAMGYARAWAERIDLQTMLPAGEMSSTGFCLAAPGRQYLIYQPHAAPFHVNLSAADGPLAVEWFDPTAGRKVAAGRGAAAMVQGGGQVTLTPPLEGDAVVRLKACH